LPPNTLTPAQLGHVRAFTSFQEGDYVTARDGYRGLLASDSTDVFAWLLLGSVEYADPWLNGSDEELWTPRKNTNLAVRAFSETVRLSPDFYLGYGHLFDIYYDLLAAGEPGFRGYGFESPRDDVIVPWENLEPTRQEFFYPVVQDSIEWVRSARSEEFKELAHSGAQSLLRDIRRRLERWAAYAPEEPKPQEELAKWHLASRRYMSGLNQAALDRAAEEALRHTAAALALGGDTTPEDLARLGALYLAADSLERAVEHTERALESLQSPGRSLSRLPPRVAANVFLARGQPFRAIGIMAPSWLAGSRAVADTLHGRIIPFGAAGLAYGKIRVYGATGLAGDSLRHAFAELNRIWSQPRYTPRDVALLRDVATRSIGPSLVLDAEARRGWFEGWETTSPLWKEFLRVESDPDSTRAWLERAGEAAMQDDREGGHTAYLLGALAQQSGADSLAIRLFGKLDSWPMAVGRADLGWGLLSLSHYRRAKSCERTGDIAEAIRHYRRFEELWRDAEPAVRPLLEEARTARERLE
jgi:tetratricopeptide (TPR) repeat protein